MWGFVCTTDADGKIFYSIDDEDLFQDQLLNRFVRDYYKPFVVMGTVVDAAPAPKKKRGRGGAGTSGGGADGDDEDVIVHLANSPRRAASRAKAVEVRLHA